MGVDRVKFYADVHVSHAVAKALREAGADYVNATELGLGLATDIEHLVKAHQLGRVLVTQDADFQALHRSRHVHSGIAYFRQGAGIGYIVSHLQLMFKYAVPKICTGISSISD